MALRLPFLSRKSNGVRVTPRAHHHIRQGDRARGRADWRAAAAAYRLALVEMPGLAHIWMQYGHASKEAGDRSAARDAYAQAAMLDPRDHEPHMFLGHLAKRARNGAAARHYLDALRCRPDDLRAIGEVIGQLDTRRADREAVDEVLALLRIDRQEVTSPTDGAAIAADTVFLDISDVLAFFAYSRFPSGVQRVQIELILALLDAGRAPIALCYHSPSRRGWTTVPGRAFRELCAASVLGDGADWERQLRLIYVASALADIVAFPATAVLISFSAGPPAPNYLLDIRTSGLRTGLVHVPLVYDLIPILFPELFVATGALAFAAWMGTMLPTMRGFVAISKATQSDMLAQAARAGYPVARSQSRVLRLDGDFRKHGRGPAPVERLATWRLSPGRYVLFVSTIEPRKNHVGAFEAWIRLARDIGEDRLPDLVCVGGRGWLNDEVHAMLAREPVLRRKAKLLQSIGDDDLDLLYRECAFTLYPSFYEGWGLPVTESLCRGKVPAISDTSSLPEAGGRFAVYFDPSDVSSIAAAVRELIVDPDILAAREAAIRDGFRPRSWLAIGDELVTEARAVAAEARDAGERVPVAPLGTHIALTTVDRIGPGAVDGEAFRIGEGWSEPFDEGSRIEGPDVMLRFAVPPGGDTLRIHLRADEAPTDYTLGSATAIRGRLAPGERRSLTIPLAARRVAEIGIEAAAGSGLIVEGFTVLKTAAT